MGLLLLYIALGIVGFMVSVLILRWALRIDDIVALLSVIANCTTREAHRKYDAIKQEEAIVRKTKRARAEIESQQT